MYRTKQIITGLLGTVALLTAACGRAPVALTSTAVPTSIVAPSATSVPTPTFAPTSTATPKADAVPSVTVAPAAITAASVITLHQIVDVQESLTYATHAGDAAVMYLVAKAGRVMVLENGVQRTQPFLDISNRVGSQGSEQGLLSIAFNLGAPADSYVYADYTDNNGDTVVSRFLYDAQTNTADPNSEQTLLTVDQPYANHNGGQLQFGPDGMLYIGMGDGGSGGDPQNHAQDPTSLLGKMLRIDLSPTFLPSVTVSNSRRAAGAGAAHIWALGLRNPWRFSFDRLTGDLYIADVGQNKYEEIDFQPVTNTSKLNYGWNIYEGFQPYLGGSAVGLTPPIYAYSHSLGCSITGGYVYRGQQIAPLYGSYVYGDYCSGTIWSLRRDVNGVWQNTMLLQSGLNISSFGEDANGELYVIDLSGIVYRVEN
jgi:glucose/arabinose dehydrogenase